MSDTGKPPAYKPGAPITYTAGNLGATATADGTDWLPESVSQGARGTYVGPSKVLGYHITYTASSTGTVIYVPVTDGMFTSDRTYNPGGHPNDGFLTEAAEAVDWRALAERLFGEFGEEPVRIGTWIDQPPHTSGEPRLAYKASLDPETYAEIAEIIEKS